MQNMQSMMSDPNAMGAPQPMGGQAPMEPEMAGAMSPPPDPSAAMAVGEQIQPEQDDMKWVDFALMQANLAKKLAKKKGGKDILAKMGEEVVKGYDEDEQSRIGWMKNNKEWLELALLVRKPKTYPWPKASNVKYPLVATAAMQFSARSFPSLVPSDGRVVKTKIPQKHPNTELYQAASRVSNHMSFQIMHRLPRWEEDMDKLLMTMAVCGICFKKTYFDPAVQENRSYLIYPENLCVNYYATDLDAAFRKTEIIPLTKNAVREKILNDEEFLDVIEEEEGFVEPANKEAVSNKLQQPAADKTTPLVFLQQHTYWDLDDDGYEEPYVITVHKASKKVVQILARWDSDGVKRNADGKIMKITPVEYYTDFPFIPNPDGSIYALGFGTLLGPLNISVNSLINMLIDAGVINNLQSGFIGKGLRIKMGEASLAPGEWRVVNATGDDLSKSIFPLPSKEPSMVLYQLMNLLIQSGNQLASIAEIFVGKMPGQNTPATTTQETVQQSMAVFTAIYKRVYRSLDMEFKKLFRLNSLNPTIVSEESKLAGIDMQGSDYDYPDWMIIPGADPVGDSDMMRAQKMQQVGQLLQFGTINVQAYTQALLDSMEIPDADKLVQQPPPPPPDPKAQMMQMEAQIKQQEAAQEGEAAQKDAALKEQLGMLELKMKAVKLQLAERESQMKLQAKEQEAKLAMVDGIEKTRTNAQMRRMDMVHAGMEHEMKMSQSERAFNQKQQQSSQAQKKKSK